MTVSFSESEESAGSEEVATGMENVLNENGTMKVLENNQVIIIRNGVKYTLQGQVISK
jgi:hypothetical protein